MDKKFQISQLSRELGYNRPSYEFWVKDPEGEVSIVSYYEIVKDKFDEDYYTRLDLFNPTIVDLTLWLIEEHQVYIEITLKKSDLYKKIEWEWNVRIVNPKFLNINIKGGIGTSYREVLEESMLETLNHLKKSYA